jgi:hypothetical protein
MQVKNDRDGTAERCPHESVEEARLLRMNLTIHAHTFVRLEHRGAPI